MSNATQINISDSALEEFGLRFGDKGAHTSRTIMLSELSDVLDAVPAKAAREAYAAAIIEQNVLGKQTASTRKLTNQRLGELYGLSPTVPVYRVMRRIWDTDQQGRPLIAFLCALARDPLLRATMSVVLPMPVGAELTRSSMTAALKAATGHRLNDSILDKVARNVASSWSQSGHLLGRVRKIRQEVHPSPGSVAFALWLGSLSGLAGEDLLRTQWARVLDQPPMELLDLALRAKQMGLINASAGGGVIEIDVSPLNATRGLF